MGGVGSGQGSRPGRWRTKPLIGVDLLRLDIRELDREQFLFPNKKRVYYWEGMHAGHAVLIEVDEHAHSLTLSYTFSERGKAPVEMHERVELIPMTTFDELELLWFACPGCGRQIRILLGGSCFRCRQCHGAAYPSQYETAAGKLNRREPEIRAKLQAADFSRIVTLPRPKHMHRKAFEAAKAELLGLVHDAAFDHAKAMLRLRHLIRRG